MLAFSALSASSSSLVPPLKTESGFFQEPQWEPVIPSK